MFCIICSAKTSLLLVRQRTIRACHVTCANPKFFYLIYSDKTCSFDASTLRASTYVMLRAQTPNGTIRTNNSYFVSIFQL